jgi:hypothetical protein
VVLPAVAPGTAVSAAGFASLRGAGGAGGDTSRRLLARALLAVEADRLRGGESRPRLRRLFADRRHCPLSSSALGSSDGESDRCLCSRKGKPPLLDWAHCIGRPAPEPRPAERPTERRRERRFPSEWCLPLSLSGRRSALSKGEAVLERRRLRPASLSMAPGGGPGAPAGGPAVPAAAPAPASNSCKKANALFD